MLTGEIRELLNQVTAFKNKLSKTANYLSTMAANSTTLTKSATS